MRPENLTFRGKMLVGNYSIVNSSNEMGKNERGRRSFPFSSVQFMNLAHIFADFKFMIVSDCGSYFWPSSVHFLVHLSSHK